MITTCALAMLKAGWNTSPKTGKYVKAAKDEKICHTDTSILVSAGC